MLKYSSNNYVLPECNLTPTWLLYSPVMSVRVISILIEIVLEQSIQLIVYKARN